MNVEPITRPSSDAEDLVSERIRRMYEVYGQDWSRFFDELDAAKGAKEAKRQAPWALIRRASQIQCPAWTAQ